MLLTVLQESVRAASPAAQAAGTTARRVAPTIGLVPTALVVGICVFIALMIAIREPPIDEETARKIGMYTVIPAMLFTMLSGGIGSPSVVLVALAVLAISVPHGPAMALLGSVCAFMTLFGVEGLRRGQVDPSQALVTASVLIATAVIPRWLATRVLKAVATSERRVAQLEELLAHDRAASAERRGDVAAMRLEVGKGSPLKAWLQMLRDLVGADEAIVWRPDRLTGALKPLAWSGDDPDGPSNFRTEEWIPLVAWAAENELVNFDASGGMPALGATAIPPRIGAVAGGALSVSHRTSLRMDREDLKKWLPRHADHVADMLALVESGDEVARQNATTLALLQAATDFQTSRTVETLGAEICASAIDVTGAAHAALLRWEPDARRGEVQAVSGQSPVRVGLVITDDSAVGGSCREATPLTWEDARELSRMSIVYGRAEPRREIRSLGVVPLLRSEGVVGAIVVEGDDAQPVRGEAVRALRLLAAIAAVSLETQWEYEEIEKRSRTDILTGLSNRRHFDEQLERLLDECDRYGGPVSLVVADIDHFKHVNDTYGHDVGDAVLAHVSRLFQDGVRTVDIVARFGGEEIACLLPQTELPGAREFAERMRRAIESRPLTTGAATVGVTVSLGVATYAGTGGSVARGQLFSMADRAMYRSKQEGRNRVNVHDPSPL